MLLYDRVRRHAATHIHSPQDAECYASLCAAQVFDIASVVPLFQDWSRDKDLPMAKRPPYPILWGEWDYEEANETRTQVWQFRLGCLLQRMPVEHLAAMRAAAIPAEKNDWQGAWPFGGIRDDFWECEEFYLGERFGYMTHCIGPGTPMLHQLTWTLGLVVFGMREGATVVRTTSMVPTRSLVERMHTQAPPLAPHERGAVSRFGLLTDLSLYTDRYVQFNVPWPLLMACALMHCRNIVQETVTPDPKLSRKHARRHRPPLTVYKTLRVKVPTDHHPEMADASVVERQQGVRLHLCRGHFKLLQHARFRHPGWYWWPAHWRGDPTLGRVEKIYALTPHAVQGEP